MKHLKKFEYYNRFSVPNYTSDDEYVGGAAYKQPFGVDNVPEFDVDIIKPKNKFTKEQHIKVFNKFKEKFTLSKNNKTEYEKLSYKLGEYHLTHPEINKGDLKKEYRKLIEFWSKNKPK